jgi:hypothetical protein
MNSKHFQVILFLFLGTFMLAGCSEEVAQGEKAPDEIHNTFLMFEERYTDEDEQSIGDLYMISEGKEKEKIASRVLDGNFHYINSQDKALFINEENELYVYDQKKGKTKLAEDVVSVNGNYSEEIVTYQNADNDLYIINKDNQEDKISSNVSQYQLIEKEIYYLDDDGDFAMYNVDDKQEAEIDSDVFSFTSLSDKQEVAYLDEDYSLYYKKENDERIKITSNEVAPNSITKIGSNLVYYNVEDESNELTISPIDEGGTPKKIASDVRDYSFEDDYYFYINNDDNLYKKKADEDNSTKLASDVLDFKLKDGTVYYTDKDNKLFKLKDNKEPEKIASSVMDYEVTPKGDLIYKTDDLDLFVNDKKIASEIGLFHQYFGNLAFTDKDDKLYLMEDMGKQKVIEDDLDQYSNSYYQNSLVYSNELTFEDVTGVWTAENEGEKIFLEIDKKGRVTYLQTGETETLDVTNAGYHTIDAVSDGTDISLSLEDDHSLIMTIDEEEGTLTKSTKAEADKYFKNVQLEADKSEISDLMDGYITDFDDAVNLGDIYYIGDYMDSGSSIYQEQTNFVQSTYEKNISERLVDYHIDSISPINEGVYTVVCTETFTIYKSGDYEGSDKTLKNTYTIKNIDGEFLITDIKVSQAASDSDSL